jgi:hypothetical protein
MSSCDFHVLYCSSMSSSCIIVLIIEQLRLPCQLRVLYCSSMSSPCIILLIIEHWAVVTYSMSSYIVVTFATPIILWNLDAYYKAVWDQTCLNLLRRHRRLFATPGQSSHSFETCAASFPTSCLASSSPCSRHSRAIFSHLWDLCSFVADLLLSHSQAALFTLFILTGARQIILMYSLARPRRLLASLP